MALDIGKTTERKLRIDLRICTVFNDVIRLTRRSFWWTLAAPIRTTEAIECFIELLPILLGYSSAPMTSPRLSRFMIDRSSVGMLC